jgi:hypothetical protein
MTQEFAVETVRYAQICGLAVATFITLLLVPVFYAIFVFGPEVDCLGRNTQRKVEAARGSLEDLRCREEQQSNC